MVFAEESIRRYNENMSFVYEAARNQPVALYMMDDDSPFQDHSGYNRNATAIGGTPSKHISLASGATWATVLENTITAEFDSPVFQAGSETKSFSLGAWVRVINQDSTAEQQILGNQNQMDGLTIKGTVVSFVTKYIGVPEARASYDLQHHRAVYVLGVHTKDKNSLYIDGELVSELTLSEDQQRSDFSGATSKLFSGGTSSSQRIAVNGIGVYPSALDSESIIRHFEAGRGLPSAADGVISAGGDSLPVSVSNSELILDAWWSTAEDWSMADHNDTAVFKDRLVPQFDGGVSLASEWLDVLSLASTGVTSIYGISMNWDGEGVRLSASIDGETWESVERGKKISLIPEGFDPTDKELYIRASFSGGFENDNAYLDNLNVIGTATPASPMLSGRTITLTGATQEREHPPLQLHENWGVEIDPGGSLVISSDTSEDSEPKRSIELWIKRKGETPTFSITGDTYINGTAGTELPQDQWVLMHIVSSTNITGDITITGPAQVGHIGLFSTPLSASQVDFQYKFYTGTNRFIAGDNSVIRVTDSPAPIKIYAHDWAIQASG